jgi:hypothetical protein
MIPRARAGGSIRAIHNRRLRNPTNPADNKADEKRMKR